MKKLSLVALIGALATSAHAEPEFYGKANLSVHHADKTDEDSTTIEMVSNASRIGVKGEVEGNDSIKGIYQIEYETSPDDGDSSGQTFQQRNIFVGLQGSFGIVKAGHFDTPLKASQNKIDLFNDQVGDIKAVITRNDVRKSNSVAYQSTTGTPFNAYVAYIASEDEEIDDSVSAAFSFEKNDLYIALAFDLNDRWEIGGVDFEGEVRRAVAQYSFSSFQIGALYEQMDIDGQDDTLDGWFVSGGYKMDNWLFKIQAGQSDQRFEGGETMSVGFDYKISKPLKIFTYYTVHNSDDAEFVDDEIIDRNYLGLGIEAKF